MRKNKMIPCRVCGKLFEPCATCQAHNDMFKWRNFACSRECAEKYINETIAYRNSLKKNSDNDAVEHISKEENTVNSSNTTNRKNNKKRSANNAENIREESEQIG